MTIAAGRCRRLEASTVLIHTVSFGRNPLPASGKPQPIAHGNLNLLSIKRGLIEANNRLFIADEVVFSRQGLVHISHPGFFRIRMLMIFPLGTMLRGMFRERSSRALCRYQRSFLATIVDGLALPVHCIY